MSDNTQADIAATRGKHCNASCSDYYCSQNVSGRCQAPNKCLGVEEAAELVAELEAAKREIANLRKENAKLREALDELVANIEMRSSTFGLNVMVDTKTYLDAKAALATTSNQNTQEG